MNSVIIINYLFVKTEKIGGFIDSVASQTCGTYSSYN